MVVHGYRLCLGFCADTPSIARLPVHRVVCGRPRFFSTVGNGGQRGARLVKVPLGRDVSASLQSEQRETSWLWLAGESALPQADARTEYSGTWV